MGWHVTAGSGSGTDGLRAGGAGPIDGRALTVRLRSKLMQFTSTSTVLIILNILLNSIFALVSC